VRLVDPRGLQRRLLYFPSRLPVAPAGELIAGARDVALRTDDGLRLGAWLVPASDPALAVAVLVANGNAGDRSMRAPLAAALAAEGLAVLLFDYRGYGGNPGRPTERGLALDALAARRALLEECALPEQRLLYYGESVGTGLVLRSPFVDLASVGRVHYPFLPVGRLLLDRYPLAAHLAEVDVPVTVVYGTRDSIIPPEQSREVARAAGGPTRTVRIPGADHNDPALVDGPQVVRAVVGMAELVRREP
jgi:fermentation-respiration switch protein FrsA (DUF1100 family)